MTLVPGASIGPYRVLEQVGRGGMATVYKAHHAALARNVAIKVLPAYLAEDEVFRERFRAEAVTIAKLRHPNILAVHDFGEEAGVYYIVTEFVDGGTLADQLGSALPVDYVVKMLGPIASALDYAHARDVVHRDVKPSNVLISRDGNPIVSDFGLARMLMGSMPRLTQTGALVGTPEYMSPEQAGGEEAGPAADRYALAVIAYEMLVGSVPYSADTPLATLIAHLHKPLPLPRSRNPRLAPAVEEVLLRGLAKEPAHRFASAAELIRALDAAAAAPAVAPGPPAAAPAAPPPAAPIVVAEPAPALAAPPAAPTPATTPPGRGGGLSRRLVLIGAVAAIVVLGGGAAAWYAFIREPEGPPLSVDVAVSADTVLVSQPGSPGHPVEVTLTYYNGRDVVLNDVEVIVRPIRDTRAVPVTGGLEPTRTAEGIVFAAGDLGPYSGGEIKYLVVFDSAGSRVVQAMARASGNLTATSEAVTINVVTSLPSPTHEAPTHSP